MKTNNLISKVALLAATTLPFQSPLTAWAGDAWQTVDNSPNAQEQSWVAGAGGDIGSNQGGIYSVGSLSTNTAGDATAMARFSPDQGTNWSILPGSEYSESGWEYAHFLGFDADQQGAFYVGGQLYNQTGPNGWHESGWVVREFHPNVGWKTTEIFQPTDAPYSGCIGLKLAPWGDLFAAGFTTALADYQGSPYWASPSWVVRKRTFDPSTQTLSDFATVDTISTTAGITWADGIGFFGDAGVIVVGQVRSTTGYNSFWTVRRSTDRGQTWATVDYLATADGYTGWLGGVAEEVVVGSNGTIYVVGAANYQSSKNRNATPTKLWLVRQSADGGTTWTTTDSFTYSSGTTPHATGITFDSSGNPIVCGYVTTANSDHWLVRKQITTTTYVKQGKSSVPVTTLSWVTSDDWQLSSGQSAIARDVTCDSSGNLYVTGNAADSSGVNHWITRRLITP